MAQLFAGWDKTTCSQLPLLGHPFRHPLEGEIAGVHIPTLVVDAAFSTESNGLRNNACETWVCWTPLEASSVKSASGEQLTQSEC